MNDNAGFLRAAQQHFVHHRATQTIRGASTAEPTARHRDVMSLARIEDCFVQQSGTGRYHRARDAESFKVRLAFRRNELATQLCSGKLLLLEQQDSHTTVRQMNRGACARWSTTGDDHVVVVVSWFGHSARDETGSDARPKRRAGLPVSLVQIIRPL